MRILVVSQFFPPEMGAPAGRFYDFARHWLAAGHRVTVVTGFPNFPGGEVHQGYRGRLYQSEEMDGIELRRCLVLTSKRRFLGRALAYASFLVSSSLCVLFARLHFDCVIATSPPPSVGLPALLAAWRRRVPLVFDVRDIWPQAIVQSGRLRNPLLISLFEGIARFLYGRAVRVTTVTEGWRERLIELGVSPEKVHVLPNGVDIDTFEGQSRQDLPAELSLLDPHAHWFTYAGILNTPQGLEVILKAAALLRDRDPDLYRGCQFVFVGEGPEGDTLQRLRHELGLDDRVLFFPRQPRAVVFSLLARSFAILVTLRPRKDTSTVPSKLYESFASGRPVLYSAGGEGAETVRRAGGGMVCTPGDPDALCVAMTAYLRDAACAEPDGRQGREFVVKAFNRGQIAARFAALLAESAQDPLYRK